jgi:hypothetical protein
MSDIIRPQKIKDDEQNLDTLFDQLETKQLDFLDESGKRIIEIASTLIGINFGIIALGSDFPPPYLQNNRLIINTLSTALVLFATAIVTGMIAIQPRVYRRYRHNLTLMREAFDKIIAHKMRWVKLAAALLGLGLVFLVVTVLLVIRLG